MEATELRSEFEKVLNGKSELNYFSINLMGKGQTRSSNNGNVKYFVSLTREGVLYINREGVYNSNAYKIFEETVNSVDEAIQIINEKCGI